LVQFTSDSLTAEAPKVEVIDPIADAVEWIEENFRIPETPDHRFTLAPYQKRALTEALRKDEHGNFVYNTVVWSDIKKANKSTLSAARGLYTAYANEWATVYVIANDLKQADSRVAYYMRRAIELNPKMKAECKINRYTIELPNHSRIEAIPVDPTGEAGGNADLLIFSELWGWKHESHTRMWTEQTLSPTKFGKSQRWIETYAGFDGESPILEQLYDTAVKNGERIDSDLELYRSGSILALWNTIPRLEWQTPEYYASEAGILPPSEFNRVHRNQWSRSSEAFVPIEWWDACRTPLPVFNRHTPMVIGIDAAVTSDLFAMVGVSRINGIVYVRYVNTWRAPDGGKIDFNEPREELERLALQYNLEAACFDPYQMAMFSGLITERGLVYMMEFTQAGKRLESDKSLYDAIRQRTIAHEGSDILREHVLNANREISPQDNKLRIVKRQENQKIDALIALSMSHHTIVELEIN
jgi:phage terminase large subunit-like protein